MTSSEQQLRALMSRSLNGDAAAHEALLRALAPMLRSYFGRRMYDAREDVDDLVQECLIAIHTRRTSYDPLRPLTPWVFAIARYKLVDYLRRAGSSPAHEALGEFDAVVEFEAASSARLDVERLLSLLPAKQRKAIRATKIRGESIAETAAAHDLSESDVKVSIHRGLKTLAAKLAGAGS